MPIILASSFNASYKDDNGVRHPQIILDHNSFITNIKKLTPNRNRVVFVANDPYDFAVTDERANILFESLKITGLEFKEKIILDGKNKHDAKEIISNADLIFLSGGKLECQLEFFREINLLSLIDGHNGLFIGGSAGAMNLCDVVFNFPESLGDSDGKSNDEFFLKGLGLYDGIVIPHLDTNTMKYGITEDGFDTMKDFILPLSMGREFIAYADDSYILISKGTIQYFGDFYKIRDGKIIPINISS